ncbi:MAG: hypothetical protein PVH64_13085 [Bacillota bacterium]|jgi:hypothetical protein
MDKQAKVLVPEIGGRVAEAAPSAPDYIENLNKPAKLLAGTLR